MNKFSRPRPASPRNRGILLIVILVLLLLAVCLCDVMRDDIARIEYPQKYRVYAENAAEEYSIPLHLLYAVIRTESDFNSGAVSSAGAIGLMQLLPDTFRWLSDDVLYERLPDGMIYDPETNLRYGSCFLSRLYARYGDWATALAAYNAGHSRVDRWLEQPGMVDENGALIYENIPEPFDETRNYVASVLSAWERYDVLYPSGQTSSVPPALR